MKIVENKSETIDPKIIRLFEALDRSGDGYISKSFLLNELNGLGILNSDIRIKDLIEMDCPQDRMSLEQFIHVSKHNIIVKAILKEVAIPDFKDLKERICEIFEKTKPISDGAVATYIPQLSRVNPDYYAASICTIDGQCFSLGDDHVPFCIQSISKAMNYCLALEEQGVTGVHEHVGFEPSGSGFNEMLLNKEGLPHNPMINSGSIMCCSLIRTKDSSADRFDYVLKMWERLCAYRKPQFNNSVYLSELDTADRNYALAYMIKETGKFPPRTDLHKTLQLYFQCCSIEVDCIGLSIAAATLANAGVCPFTNEVIYQPETVKNCLTLLYSCGMYDYSGHFAFLIGLPAKSGVSGAILIVIPNLMGIGVYSPRLDGLGNSVRGLKFCEELVKTYNFHVYDSLVKMLKKIDPRRSKKEVQVTSIVALCAAASMGDLEEVQRLYALGFDLNTKDYDGRTALHLAACNGHLTIIEYLISKGVDLNPLDRWKRTPLDDAKTEGYPLIAHYLEQQGATHGAREAA